MVQQLSNVAVDDADIAAEASWTELQAIGTLYSWDNFDNVERFLIGHPGVRSALIEGASLVQSCFGPGTELTLRVAHRVEDDGAEQLVAFIRTPFGVDESLTRLDRFDADWWLDEVPKVRGLLTFTLSYA